MYGAWAEKTSRAGQAGRIARRVIGSSVAANHAVAVPLSGVSASRSPITAKPAELCVIEHIECFSPEFEVFALRDGEVLDQRHIEIRPPGIIQNVSPGIAK